MPPTGSRRSSRWRVTQNLSFALSLRVPTTPAWCLIVTAISLFLGAMAAYALARFKSSASATVLMFLITTQMFPLVLLCIPYFRIFITLGPLRYAHVAGDRLPDLHPAVLHPDAAQLFHEHPAATSRRRRWSTAARRLGAIFRTLVPMSYPAFIGAGLYTFLLAWNEFLFAVVLIEFLGEPRPDHGDLQPDGRVRDRLEHDDGFLGPGQPAAGGRLHLPADATWCRA